MESSEKSKVFIKRKKSTVRVDRHGLTQRDSSALIVVWFIFMGYFFRVFSGQSLWFAWFWLCIWYISWSSHVCALIAQSKWIPVKRPVTLPLVMNITNLASLPFWSPRNFLVKNVSLTLRMRNRWSLIWAGPSPLSPVLLLIFWSFCPENKLIARPGYGDHIPPASVLHGRRGCS